MRTSAGTGGVYEPGWTAEVFVRQSGNSVGTRDAVSICKVFFLQVFVSISIDSVG